MDFFRAQTPQIFCFERALIRFVQAEKSHSILGNLSTTFTVSEPAKPKVKPIQKQCFFVDHHELMMVVPREGTISKRSASTMSLDEQYDISDIIFVGSQPAPKAGAPASFTLRFASDARELSYSGPQDQVDLWVAALQAAETARMENIPSPLARLNIHVSLLPCCSLDLSFFYSVPCVVLNRNRSIDARKAKNSLAWARLARRCWR